MCNKWFTTKSTKSSAIKRISSAGIQHCISSDPLTPPRGKINWCQTWLGNTQGVRFSHLALCILRLSADIFKHIKLGK